VVETAAHGGGDMTQINEGNYADEALLAMKSRPKNEDGTIGVTITPDMPEWNAWQAYFLGKRMDRRASFMRSRGKSGYMVPCRNPGDFDFDVAMARQEYARRIRDGEIPAPDTSRKAHEIPYDERCRMADELKAIFARVAANMDMGRASSRSITPDRREAPPPTKEPVKRDMTPAEVASMKRMLRIPETDEDI
jgi:hypothetical protein